VVKVAELICHTFNDQSSSGIADANFQKNSFLREGCRKADAEEVCAREKGDVDLWKFRKAEGIEVDWRL